MDGVRDFLSQLADKGLVKGRLLAVLHVVIGRTLRKSDGTLVSMGLSWRQVSELFRDLRIDKELVREVGLDPNTLSPRDRQRFWFQAIAAAKPDSEAAKLQAVELIAMLPSMGYSVD